MFYGCSTVVLRLFYGCSTVVLRLFSARQSPHFLESPRSRDALRCRIYMQSFRQSAIQIKQMMHPLFLSHTCGSMGCVHVHGD